MKKSYAVVYLGIAILSLGLAIQGQAVLELLGFSFWDLSSLAALIASTFGSLVGGKLPAALTAANTLYSIGALVLFCGPLIEYRRLEPGEDRNFQALLMTLQAYLALSALFVFFPLELLPKILVRLSLSITVTIWVKYCLKALPNIPVAYTLNPLFILGVLARKYKGPAALVVGVDWLGFGYCFNDVPVVGPVCFLVGSLALLFFAWDGWRAKVPLASCWTVLNVEYTVFSVLALASAIRSLTS